MSITLGQNIQSIRSARILSDTSNRLGAVFERLSSGQRINRASDDAAGLAIASQLRTDSKVLGQAYRNINDGVSLLAIADSTLGEAISILDRIEELSIQAANGAYSDDQRTALDDEAQSLRDEFHRILSVAKFNDKQIFTSSDSTLNIQLGLEGDDFLDVNFREDVATASGLGTYTTTNVNAAGGPPGSPTAFDSGVLTDDFNNDGIDDVLGIFVCELKDRCLKRKP